MAAGTRPKPQGQTIALQVGSELRMSQNGEIKLSNPTVEVENAAVDAAINVFFDPERKEYVIRLVDPVVEHEDRENQRG